MFLGTLEHLDNLRIFRQSRSSRQIDALGNHIQEELMDARVVIKFGMEGRSELMPLSCSDDVAIDSSEDFHFG